MAMFKLFMGVLGLLFLYYCFKFLKELRAKRKEEQRLTEVMADETVLDTMEERIIREKDLKKRAKELKELDEEE